MPIEDKRIPMSDGAGEVLSVSEAVEGFQVGDTLRHPVRESDGCDGDCDLILR